MRYEAFIWKGIIVLAGGIVSYLWAKSALPPKDQRSGKDQGVLKAKVAIKLTISVIVLGVLMILLGLILSLIVDGS